MNWNYVNKSSMGKKAKLSKKNILWKIYLLEEIKGGTIKIQTFNLHESIKLNAIWNYLTISKINRILKIKDYEWKNKKFDTEKNSLNL